MIRTVGDLIEHAANKYPEKEGVFHKNTALTYARIYEQSLQLAHTLKQLGVGKENRVCFYLEKRLEKVIAIFGIALAEAVFVPIRRLSLSPQAVHIIRNCEARVVITTSSRIPALKDHLHKLRAVITVDSTDILEPGCPVISWNEVMSCDMDQKVSTSSIQPDIAAILYTSGSTGRPKGVVFSHQNILTGAFTVSEYLKITANDRLLSILTFGFDYGLNQLTSSVLHGAQLILYDYLFPKDILNVVDRYKITGLAAVATTWIQLLQIPWGNKMESLRYITNSGGSIPVQYVKEMRKRIPDTAIYLMYGLTEAFRSTYLEPSMVDQRPSSIGKAIPGEHIMILDENDHPVQPGSTGELVHRGPMVSLGYWNDPESTALRFRKNPLQPDEIPVQETIVFSGDYARMDADGFIYFEGRKDEMIKSAGNRISPTEIEEILYNSNLVTEAVALGIPHEIYGQVVLAVLSLYNIKNNDGEKILAYCRQNMPPYMVPHEIEIWKKLPVNSNGKLDRARIKKVIYMKKGIEAVSH